jgi:UDP-N-acetylmuramyl pentapeptide phosphotransferase/UDP-N-acetylglucosamine-1-phosphate transferase
VSDPSVPPPSREPPRLGPWLRRYTEEERPDRRQRIVELALSMAGGVAVLAGAVAVVWLFVRFPWQTGAALVLVWGLGFTVLVFKRRAAAERERRLRDALTGDERRTHS